MVRGFNVGATISLGDMSLALSFLNDKEFYQPDLADVKSELGTSIEIEDTIIDNEQISAEYKLDSIVSSSELGMDDFSMGNASTDGDIQAGEEDDEDSGLEDFFGVDDADANEDDSDEDVSDEQETIENEPDEPLDEMSDEEIEDDMESYFEEDDEDEDEDYDDEDDDEDDEDDLYEDDEDAEDGQVEIRESAPEIEMPTQQKRATEPIKEYTVQATLTSQVDVESEANINSEADDEEAELLRKLEETRRRKDSEARKARLAELQSQLEAEEAEIRKLQNLKTTNKTQVQSASQPQSNATAQKIAQKPSPQSQPRPQMQAKQEPQQSVKRITVEEYSSYDVEKLYKHVKHYMIHSGVKQRVIGVKELEVKFGASNINKLILKSYLISMGKGVTIGK